MHSFTQSVTHVTSTECLLNAVTGTGDILVTREKRPLSLMDPTFQCERDGQPTRDRQGENNAVLKPKQGKGPRGLEAHFD